MAALTLGEIATLAGGQLVGVPDQNVRLTGPVVADSRRIEAGCLFVAIPGERVDGHEFAAAALAGGAVAVLGSRPMLGPAIMVADSVLGLGLLARGYLVALRVQRAPLVVSITGSSGKTSTKDLLAQVLSTKGATVAPEGSFNTEVGLPLTVMRADASTRYLVLEASARGVGHIAYLCGIARPDIAVVLNVGSAHLGEFGSLDAVARAKGELVESLELTGLAVLNADDPAVAAMRSRTRARVVTVGTHVDADVRASAVRLDGLARPSFQLSAAGLTVDVELALHGVHQVSNALAVAAVALEAGMELPAVAAALSQARPVSRWRMEVATRPDGVIVINDAYNANPDSVRAALDALLAIDGRRRWAVLGEMAELGSDSGQAHEEVGAAAVKAGVDRLIVVGDRAATIATGALGAGLPPGQVSRVDDAQAAVELLNGELHEGDVVLVKASRSADLQRVAQALLSAGATKAGPTTAGSPSAGVTA